MFANNALTAPNKTELYADLNKQLKSLLDGERDFIANAANFSALLFNLLPDLNWAGFYLMRGDELILGPFQGKPACVRIPVHPSPRGVCGNTAFHRRTFLVPNVHEFPGHIACDSASNSEVVIPILNGDHLVGVLDLDSPNLNRFDTQDQSGLELMVATFIAATDLPAKA
ncbi:MAG: GAF domain-containing protein [Burkholderiales bacterium]|jgi:GAF domain-containing protein